MGLLPAFCGHPSGESSPNIDKFISVLNHGHPQAEPADLQFDQQIRKRHH